MEANELTEDFLGTSAAAALVADGELALTPPTFDRLPFTFLNIFCFYKDDKIFALETICLWVLRFLEVCPIWPEKKNFDI